MNHNISATFIEAMKDKGVTVEKLAQATGISERFINSILSDQFSNLPPAPYVHGYIVKIADFLGLDGEEIWQVYFKDSDLIKRSGQKDNLPGNRFVTGNFQRYLLIFGGIIGIGGVLFYFISRPLLFSNLSNSIDLFNLSDNVVSTKEQTFVIKGRVKSNLELTINNQKVYPNKDGIFEQPVELQPGFNLIDIRLRNAVGREQVLAKQVFLESATSTKNSSSTEETPAESKPDF